MTDSFIKSGTFKSEHIERIICGIRTIIIDPHNEIMPYWFREFLRQRKSLIAVRIDAHHDMFQCAPALPAREGRETFRFLSALMPHVLEYSQRMVNEGNFTCPTFHYGVLGALYHFHPSKNRIDAYGRVCGLETIDPPKTKERRICPNSGKTNGRVRWITWDKEESRLTGDCGSAKAAPVPSRISLAHFQRDMQECSLPVALGIDLDGLYGNDDRGGLFPVLKRRLESVKELLGCVRRPAFICLARSQTPRSYIPASAVDRVQEAALGLIQEVYGVDED